MIGPGKSLWKGGLGKGFRCGGRVGRTHHALRRCDQECQIKCEARLGPFSGEPVDAGQVWGWRRGPRSCARHLDLSLDPLPSLLTVRGAVRWGGGSALKADDAQGPPGRGNHSAPSAVCARDWARGPRTGWAWRGGGCRHQCPLIP